MTSPTLIGITGKATSGKNELGEMLEKAFSPPTYPTFSLQPIIGYCANTASPTKNVKCYALASPIKKIIGDLMGWDHRHSDGYLKEVPVLCGLGSGEEFVATLRHHLSGLTDEDIFAIAKNYTEIIFKDDRRITDNVYPISPRQMYQEFGTDVCRTVVDSIWLDQAIAEHAKGESLIITDIRFENEAAWIREHGTLIHIQRDAVTKVTEHSSEAGIAVQGGDIEVSNNNSLSMLRTYAEQIVHDIMHTTINTTRTTGLCPST